MSNLRAKQKEIIQTLKVKKTIDPQKEIRLSIDFMKEYLLAHPFLESLVLGISGGQDSTLAGKLAQLAIDELRQDHPNKNYQFIAVALPYGKQNDQEDVEAAMEYIQPDTRLDINIKEATDASVKELEAAGLIMTDYNKGNIKARQRMVSQFAIAGAKKGAVIGTDHAAESVTGFFTKFGDGAADLMPLWRLTKGQGRELLKALNCPSNLYLKIPTADLEENRPLLSDEEALGVSYQDIDAYLMGEDLDEEVAQKIEDWYKKSEHKRHMPITVFDSFWKR